MGALTKVFWMCVESEKNSCAKISFWPLHEKKNGKTQSLALSVVLHLFLIFAFCLFFSQFSHCSDIHIVIILWGYLSLKNMKISLLLFSPSLSLSVQWLLIGRYFKVIFLCNNRPPCEREWGRNLSKCGWNLWVFDLDKLQLTTPLALRIHMTEIPFKKLL